MIHELVNPEIPVTKPNTHAMVERITLYPRTDGKANANLATIKGRYEGEVFIPDPDSRREIGIDSLDVPEDMKVSDLPKFIESESNARNARAVEAERLREEARKKNAEAEQLLRKANQSH